MITHPYSVLCPGLNQQADNEKTMHIRSILNLVRSGHSHYSYSPRIAEEHIFDLILPLA